MINVEKARIDYIRNDDLATAKVYIEALEGQCRAFSMVFSDPPFFDP